MAALVAMVALAAAACSGQRAVPTEVAPAPGSAQGTTPAESAITHDPGGGIKLVREGVISPKCDRRTVSILTVDCAEVADGNCRAEAERKIKIRADHSASNVVMVTTEEFKDNKYRIGGTFWHCPQGELDLNMIPNLVPRPN